jgi:hypothetical protein
MSGTINQHTSIFSLTGGHHDAVKYITDLEWRVRNLSTALLSLSEMTDIHRRGWDEENVLGRRRRISTMAMVFGRKDNDTEATYACPSSNNMSS